MSSFPLRQLILPAVIVASGVFSILTLPLVLYRPDSVDIKVPFSEDELHFVFEGGNRDLAIRYVGVAIVTSVAAGVTTVELKRRSHNRKEAALEAALQRSEAVLDVAAPEVVASFSSPAVYDSVDEYFAAAAVAIEPEPAIEPDKLEILTNSNRYETCRIQVPNTDRRFFAILVNGEYYRLFRARKTKEKAIEMADRLRERGDRVMITEMSQGHALWIWEPQAYIILG
ncbi:hypothetical protein H6F67_25265 [Microcoleus sp. FACHB-1515]|uniref:hypothetical protein n=1 Tax=Cyanophyceae TaxID=3028117 RepID=UPI0016824E14|nr:hypothetical protein [Microcoleus sp. FACHB-1515]MBD2093159.1 hypothetical protein [Microcoleus sp. FACHB-1515]